MHNQALLYAVSLVINQPSSSVTVLGEWAYVYFVRVGKRCTFVSKAKVQAILSMVIVTGDPTPVRAGGFEATQDRSSQQYKVLATHTTRQGLEILLNQYLAANGYRITLDLRIVHSSVRVPPRLGVVLKANRYYLVRYVNSTIQRLTQRTS